MILTKEQLEHYGQLVIDDLEEGFELSDLPKFVPKLMEIVEIVDEMTSEEKRQSVEAMIDYVLESTDTPWLPDAISDPIIATFLKGLIPVIADATKGKYGIN